MKADVSQRKNQKARFSLQDDKLLTAIIQSVGTSNWEMIASLMETRTARQCRERWTHYLSPTIQTKEWEPIEDSFLLTLVEKMGSKWTKNRNV